MTTQAEELLGARVIGADGKVVGTVEQVFRDDVDGTPAWARVRSGKTGRFVPLATGQVTKDGLNVPFDSQKIMGGPNIDAGQHMSAAQAEELTRYYGLTVPAQAPRDPSQSGQQESGEQQSMQRSGQQESGQQESGQQESMQEQGSMSDSDWMLRLEERFQVDMEMIESSRVKLHKYVDVQPVEQAVHVYHEEYDVERIPISADEQTSGGTLEEGVQEIVLHEQRAVIHKQTVPVERVRLITKRVDEDKTIQGELRRERIEIEPD
jgi:uncharacterized protein (TIGR02271 family)